MKKYLIVVALTFVASFSFSQKKNSLVILAKPKADGIWLRWAPVEVSQWQLGNKYGYAIERFTLLPNGDLEMSSKTTLTPTPIKPYTEEQFSKLENASDETLAIEELLYSETFKKSYSSNDVGTVLSKSKELENRFGMALLMCDFSIDAATAAGLFLKDTNVQKGKRYIYRLKIASPSSTPGIEPVVTVVEMTDEKPQPLIKDLAVEFSNRKATLSWSTLLHKAIYTAYYVERSEDGKTFKQLYDLPYVHMTSNLTSETAYFVDSLESNHKTFTYRIRGISPFAETGPYSNTVKGEGKDNLAGLLIIREGKVISNNKVRLIWEFPEIAEKQIEGFIVSSSKKAEGPYTDLVKKPVLKNMRAFFNETAHYNTYYTVRAVDKLGKEITRSFPFLVQIADETPPANPTGLTGTVEKNGVVTLKWNANTDSDIFGYRVFRNNALHEEFVEVTKEFIRTPTFTDTINTQVLDKKIYYAVVAVDKNYNPSDYSNILKLNRPDIIAPTAPVFTKAEMTNDSITLVWENSVSNDVAKYELIRIEKEERLSRVIKSWRATDSLTHYNDPSLTLGKTYTYQITVYDSTENKSTGTSKQIFFESGLRKAVTNVESMVEREKKQIALKWKNETAATKCILYRKVNQGSFILYKTIDGNVESFIDKGISISNTYTYKIQNFYPNGIKSRLSEEIVVNY